MNHPESSINSDSRLKPDSPKTRGRLVRIAKWLIVVVVTIGLCFAGRSAVSQWNAESQKMRARISEIQVELSFVSDSNAQRQLRSEQNRLERSIPSIQNLRWRWIGFAAVFYGLGLIPPSMVLHQAVGALGDHPRRSTTIAAQLLGHVGKYVPGKAMVIVLRAGALSKDGVRPLTSTVSVFMETFLMMAVGAAVGGVITWWMPVPRWIAGLAAIAAVVASLPTLPPIMKIVAARVTKAEVENVDSRQLTRLFFEGWCWSVLSWLLIGSSFTCLLVAIPSSIPLPPPVQLYAIGTAAICLAMVIGFVSLLPGGAGVRELVLTTVLGVSIGPAHGLLTAIAARIVFIVVECVLALAASIWFRLRSLS